VAGVAHDAELTMWLDGRASVRRRGALLWTHVGVSGPSALDISRHWLRAILEQRAPALTMSLMPGETLDSIDRRLTALIRDRPRAALHTIVSTLVPASLAGAMLAALAIDAAKVVSHLARDDRRRVARALVEWPLPVSGSRGYAVAEATAGGVSLAEIDPATMQSRVCPGLFLVGEMLDVDGRLGGFNFQWAWSTAFVASRGLARSRS
jgi:predicted Rossmann fold flavoprotein